MIQPVVECVVDNHVFLLGLDQYYRDGMKLLEAKVLLDCASAVARRLGVSEADVPVEGYYDDPAVPELPRYFRFMRALQRVTQEEASTASGMPELQRLVEVAESGMYGRPQYESADARLMLPVGRDAFSTALRELKPTEWNVGALVARARSAAVKDDDFSLVGLAARAADPVALAALRESVVLYAEKRITIGGGLRYVYAWRVDEGLARCADRFIEVFNRLVAGPNSGLRAGHWMSGIFNLRAFDPIPRAVAENAPHFYDCFKDNAILGRCVHLGTRTDTGEKYHWAVRAASDHNSEQGMEVHDFWSHDLWTTSRYRAGHKPSLPPRPDVPGIGRLDIV